MEAQSLTELAEQQLAAARESSSGRSAVTVFGGQEHDLRQTLIALAEGHALGEHQSPGEGSVQVLRGSVRLTTGGDSWTGSEGDYLILPPERHELHAATDAAVLLTVAIRA